MLVTQFTTDEEEGSPAQNSASEYAFEGFNIEFSEKIALTPVNPARGTLVKSQSVSHQFTLDPNRAGTFIIADIYQCDFSKPHKGGGCDPLDPPFHKLPGLVVDGKEVVGCVIKATQALANQWPQRYLDWFTRSWKKIREVGGDRYGVDFFRGCYHYLIFSVDGAKQADFFCDTVDAAGGWGPGDLMPWVDIEEGGQGSWAPQELEKITDKDVRRRLADQVTTCATAFIKRFKERTGLRIAVYGRGVFRDLQMTNCKFGSDSAVNPAYTAVMPKMDKYGVPLDDISLWQLCGDGTVALKGFPSELPGWGKEDYSVYIDGDRKTTLKSLRERCLALPPSAQTQPVAQGQSISRPFVLEPTTSKRDEMPRAPFERINQDEDRREAREKIFQQIIQLAANSNLARSTWSVGPGREVAPIGYIKGMAVVFATVVCKLRNGDAAATDMAKANTGHADTDALAYLAPEFAAAGLRNDVAGADTLRHLWVLLMSLGMRESGGRYCQGRDTSANNKAADTAEAGPFQASFNARKGSALMTQLFQHYRVNRAGFVEIFREGVTCTAADLQNFGAGDGAAFQELSKSSPAFAAEFAALGLRNIRQIWGPINAKTVEIRQDCDDFLRQVQDLVDAQNLCAVM